MLRDLRKSFQCCPKTDGCCAGVEVNQPQEFTVDTSDAGGQGLLEIAVVSVSGWSV